MGHDQQQEVSLENSDTPAKGRRTNSSKTPTEGAASTDNGTPTKRRMSPTKGAASTNNGTPTKRRTSPTKGAASTDNGTPTKRRTSPRKAAASTGNVNETIRSILANMAPPTEDEIRENRGQKSDPLPETENSPDVAAKADSSEKLFPIFSKGFSAKGVTDSAKKTAASKRKLQLATTATEEGKSGLKQAVIDAGQKNIGAEYCVLCDFFYTVGDATDERLHNEKHNLASGIVKFAGKSFFNEYL